MKKKAPRRGPGRQRSPEGRVPLNLTVPPYVDTWLKRKGNASAEVRRLVDEAMKFIDKRTFSDGQYGEGHSVRNAERAGRIYVAAQSSQGWALYSSNDVDFPYEIKAGARPLSSGKWVGDELNIPDSAFEAAVKNGEKVNLRAIYGQHVNERGVVTPWTLWAEEDNGRWWQAGVERDMQSLTATESNGRIEIRGRFFGVFYPNSGECERVGMPVAQGASSVNQTGKQS